jgi:hypothetical protein
MPGRPGKSGRCDPRGRNRADSPDYPKRYVGIAQFAHNFSAPGSLVPNIPDAVNDGRTTCESPSQHHSNADRPKHEPLSCCRNQIDTDPSRPFDQDRSDGKYDCGEGDDEIVHASLDTELREMLQYFPAFRDEDRVFDAAQAKFAGTAMARRPFEPFDADHNSVGHHLTGNATRGRLAAAAAASILVSAIAEFEAIEIITPNKIDVPILTIFIIDLH